MYDFPFVNFNSRGGISHSSDSEVAVRLSATKAGADGVPTSSIVVYKLTPAGSINKISKILTN